MPRSQPLSAPLQHLELRAYGAALTDAGVVAQLGRLRALSLDVDLSFFGASAERQVCVTHTRVGLQAPDTSMAWRSVLWRTP